VAPSSSNKATNDVGGYGENYPYLGYYQYPGTGTQFKQTINGVSYFFDEPVKLTTITDPPDTILNSDSLDPLYSDVGTVADIDYYGYSYAPSFINGHLPGHTYTRHDNVGDNYAWADGHVQFMKWNYALNGGMNNQSNWWWMIPK
jgi:prepilin-type processing-associated H-X9-DG protein